MEKCFDVVYAVRKTIKTTFIKKIMRHSFYLIYSYLVNKNFLIPKNTGDFRLIDKKIITQLKSMRERTRFLRGLVSFIGAKQKSIEFDRPFRKKVNPNLVYFLIKYGFDAILSSTAGPANLITKFGLLSLGIIFLFLIFILINKYFLIHMKDFHLQ